jgi:Zn-finger nucleic acid-binding protein
MEAHEVGLVILDRCRSCSGLWFDMGEFDRSVRIVTGSYDPKLKLQSMLDSVAVRREGGETLRCPACTGRLIAWSILDPELEIDACARCKGLWLDEGEFETIHRSVDARRPTLSPQDLEKIQQRPVGSAGASFVADLMGDMPRHDLSMRRRSNAWSLIHLLDRIFH